MRDVIRVAGGRNDAERAAHAAPWGTLSRRYLHSDESAYRVSMRIVDRDVPEAAHRALLRSGIPPMLARVYAARGIESSGDLDYRLARLAPPIGLGNIETAAHIIGLAIRDGKRLAVCGDFDVDGSCGSALLYDGIVAMGGRTPVILIPSRFKEGYGLSRSLVDAARDEGAKVIVTVDNGITAFDAIDYAHSLGITPIVSDHHLAAENDRGVHLPSAAAIVNPNVPGCAFPWKSTCGAGVAFYLVAAVRAWMRSAGKEEHVPLERFLDLVALATVCDVVPLEYNNRIFVTQGLRRLRTSPRPGLAALFAVAGLDVRRACVEDFAFRIGAMLNAAGRLASMDLGVRLLLEHDPERAMAMAKELDQLNSERRTIEAGAVDDALAGMPDPSDIGSDRALVFFGEQWHEGVVGLVASRLRERFHRPVVALCKAQNGTIKGSGRSIPGLHLRDALARVDAVHPGLMKKWGGHAAACGLEISTGQIEAFRAAFTDIVGGMVPSDALQPTLSCDGELRGIDINIEAANELQRGGPWGNGFPEPIFRGVFRVRDYRILKGAHRSLTLEKDGRVFRAIQFRNAEEPPDEATFVYRMHANLWNGEEQLQLKIEYVDLDAAVGVQERLARTSSSA